MNLKKTIYNLISNPLVQIVILLLIILTILGMIRVTEPDFKLGASIGGNKVLNYSSVIVIYIRYS